jgi:hypothetical protein
MDNSSSYFPIFVGLFILFLMIVCCFGMYKDHEYRMKKLELIEQGKIKAEVEKI